MKAADIAALPYRPCVGVMVLNPAGLVFVGERTDTPGAWQMPQGGIDPGEAPRDAALRELWEETGISAGSVEIIAEAPDWLTYDLPVEVVPKIWKGQFRGQKQRWFLLRFRGEDSEVGVATTHAEFGRWAWLPPAELVHRIVPFKRATYAAVLEAFRGHLAGGSA